MSTQDDFQGYEDITVRPGDDAIPYGFVFTPCSGANVNDGSIPYGTTVSTVAVTAHVGSTGVDATAQLIDGVPTVLANKVTIPISYPGSANTYHLRIVLTLNTGAKVEADFERVISKV